MMLNVRRWGAGGKSARCLIVICHGVGADASQAEVFVDYLMPLLPHAAFLSPDGPEPFDAFPEGRQWFSLRDRSPAVLDAGARRAAPPLNATIDAEGARLSLGAGAVALIGFSQGAMMVLHAGLRRLPAPCAILAYSGALLDSPALQHECVGHPPVLLVHGEQDMVVPFSRGPEAEGTLRRLGVPVQTCWRPGLGHSVDREGLQAGLKFLQTTLPQIGPRTEA